MAKQNEHELPITELAVRIGVSRPTLYTWEKKLGCPIREGEAAVREWIRINKPEGATVHQQLLDAKLAKTLAEADRVELENAVTRARYVEKDAVERWLTQFVAGCRAQIESWPEKVLSELSGEARLIVRDFLAEQVRLLLVSLASMPSECWADEAVQGESEPAVAESAAD